MLVSKNQDIKNIGNHSCYKTATSIDIKLKIKPSLTNF